MAKREDTKTLEKIGMLWLKSNQCYLISPETKVWRRGIRRLNELDNHYIIDLLGVGKKWIPDEKRVPNEQGYESPTIDVLRGIEIKVSLSDFKNGFIQNGCNYHYVMAPKEIIPKDRIPKGIGFIEVDLDNFTWSKWGPRYYLRGLEVIKPPRFKAIDDFQFSYATREIAYNCSNQMIRWAREQLTKYIHKHGGKEE